MRSLFTLVVTLLLTSCCLMAQDHNYKAEWELNTETDMDNYRLYITEMEDTLNTPFSDGADSYTLETYLYNIYSHDSLYTINSDLAQVSFLSSVNGRWLQAAICAIDTAGNRSAVSVSNFLKKDDQIPPAKVAGFSIKY